MVHEVLKKLGEYQVRLLALVREGWCKGSVLGSDIKAHFDDFLAAPERERELPFAIGALTLFEHLSEFRNRPVSPEHFLTISVAVILLKHSSAGADDEVWTSPRIVGAPKRA
jgi:hypothetical protein